MSQFSNVHILTVVDRLQDANRTKYDSRIEDQVFNKGMTINRLFKPNRSQVCHGKTLEVQTITGFTDSARATRSTLSDISNPRNMDTSSLTLRHNPNSPSTNDFTRVDVACEISDHDLKRPGNAEETAVSILEKVEDYAMKNLDYTNAFMIHADKNGKWALVNGTKKNSDGKTIAASTTYTSGSTSAWVPIDGASIAAFERNTHWDFYSAAGVLLADECRVRARDAAGSAILVELSENSTATNLNSIADNAEIYRSGEKGNGYRGSLTEWFTAPSSGDSFLGGVDRLSTEYRYLIPTTIRDGATASKIKESMLDDLAEHMSNIEEDPDRVWAAVAHTSVIQSLRRDMANNSVKLEQANAVGDYQFGSNVLKYIHPHFGQINLVGDPMSPLDSMKFLDLTTWTDIPAVQDGFEWVPPSQGAGYWFRKDGTSPNAGKQLVWRKEGYKIKTIYCYRPEVNAAILNITA